MSPSKATGLGSSNPLTVWHSHKSEKLEGALRRKCVTYQRAEHQSPETLDIGLAQSVRDLALCTVVSQWLMLEITGGYKGRKRLCLKWHPIPYIMHLFWPETYGPWVKGEHYLGIRVPFWKEHHVLNYWPSTLLITSGGHSLSWENHFWPNNCTYSDLLTYFQTCITYLKVWWAPIPISLLWNEVWTSQPACGSSHLLGYYLGFFTSGDQLEANLFPT